MHTLGVRCDSLTRMSTHARKRRGGACLWRARDFFKGGPFSGKLHATLQGWETLLEADTLLLLELAFTLCVAASTYVERMLADLRAMSARKAIVSSACIASATVCSSTEGIKDLAGAVQSWQCTHAELIDESPRVGESPTRPERRSCLRVCAPCWQVE